MPEPSSRRPSASSPTSRSSSPSTPEDPSVGVLDGLRLLAEAKGMSLGELARWTHLIVHGTTVTTNAMPTRGGAASG